jgi:hypothetical protein
MTTPSFSKMKTHRQTPKRMAKKMPEQKSGKDPLLISVAWLPYPLLEGFRPMALRSQPFGWFAVSINALLKHFKELFYVTI